MNNNFEHIKEIEEWFYSGLSAFINNVDLPFSILIDWSWGVGKTTLFNDISSSSLLGEKWKIIKINTWDLSQRENFREALLYKILKQILDSIDNKKYNKVYSFFQEIIKKSNVEINVWMFKINFDKEEWDIYGVVKSKIMETINKSKFKYLLFIDDLDRIKPNQAIEAVDLIKNFFLDEELLKEKIENKIMCITACDKDIIKLWLKNKFGDDSDRYYDKYFKKLFQFSISPLKLEDYCGKYLEKDEDYKRIFYSQDSQDENIQELFKEFMVFASLGNFRDLERIRIKHKVLLSFIDKLAWEIENKEKLERYVIIRNLEDDIKKLQGNKSESIDGNYLDFFEWFEQTLKEINLLDVSLKCYAEKILLYLWSISINSDSENIDFESFFDENSSNCLIVPVKDDSLDWATKNNIYICPKERKFQKIWYIAFYNNKKIIWYWKIVRNALIEDNNPLLDEWQKEYIRNHERLYWKYPRQYFILEKFEILTIEHQHNYAFVQKRAYREIEMIKSAKTTDELRTS